VNLEATWDIKALPIHHTADKFLFSQYVEDIHFVFDAERIKSIFLFQQRVLQSCIDPKVQMTADGRLL
jgi:hypothetical protein